MVSESHPVSPTFGTSDDRGDKDCDGRPGQLGHEKQDAEYFAQIGVDWLKSDSWNPNTAISHYAAMRDALALYGLHCAAGNHSTLPIRVTECGGMWLANSARIGPDTGSGGRVLKRREPSISAWCWVSQRT
eukprot:m.476754 g.476754  ORF g.476754 m.476754 type:complete len:131 (+) comp41760_c0_seq1:144-536(+)